MNKQKIKTLQNMIITINKPMQCLLSYFHFKVTGGESTLIGFAEKARLWKWCFWDPDNKKEMVMQEQRN